MKCAENMACMGERRGECTVLVRKPVGKRPVGKPRRRGTDNIRMHSEEIGCEIVDWIDLVQDRVVMNLRVP